MREMLAPGVWSDNVPSSAIARPGSYRTLGGSIVTARKAPSLGIVTNGELIRHRRQTAKRHANRPQPAAPGSRFVDETAASLTADHDASRTIGVSRTDRPEAHP